MAEKKLFSFLIKLCLELIEHQQTISIKLRNIIIIIVCENTYLVIHEIL